jgi:carboxymethylenebutenolidase
MDQRYIDLYDAYTHTTMSRREFLDRMTALAGSAAVASGVISMLDLDTAKAAEVDPKDARLTTETVSYSFGKETAKAYVARPKTASKTAKVPAVVVIHENKGLTGHIEDVARRLAVAGYVGVAPDGLSTLGGTPADPEKGKELIGKLEPATALALFLGAVEFAKGLDVASGSVGAVGFCWGGAMANQLAVSSPTLKGAVAYYGRQPTADEAKRIKAKLLLHYAGKDERVNAGIADYEKALKAAGVGYELHMYPEAQHAFHNDTAGERYDKKAAELSWERTLAFFKKTLA